MLINNAYIENGHLIAIVNENSSTVVTGFEIIDGNLIATVEPNTGANVVTELYINDGRLIGKGLNMAKIDLGQVVGPQGEQGPQGERGEKGENGITPTFSIENGHLFADYDNPYVTNE